MSIRMSYGLQLALALVGGACLDLPNHECTHDTTHMMVGLHHHPDLLPLQGQLTAATSRQNRPSTRRALSLDPGASTCSECYYAYYLGDVHRSAFVEGDLERHLEVSALRQLRLVKQDLFEDGTVDTTNRPSTWRGLSAIILRLWS